MEIPNRRTNNISGSDMARWNSVCGIERQNVVCVERVFYDSDRRSPFGDSFMELYDGRRNHKGTDIRSGWNSIYSFKYSRQSFKSVWFKRTDDYIESNNHKPHCIPPFWNINIQLSIIFD